MENQDQTASSTTDKQAVTEQVATDTTQVSGDKAAADTGSQASTSTSIDAATSAPAPAPAETATAPAATAAPAPQPKADPAPQKSSGKTANSTLTKTITPAPAAAPAEATPTVTEADLAQLSPAPRAALQTIHAYLEAMKPGKPVSIEEGSRHQIALYRAISTIMNNTEDEFSKAFSLLLKTFEQHKDGALHERHVFRFFEHMTLPEPDRRAFQRLLNMVKVLAPVKGRELAMKQVDFTSSLAHGVTERTRQRVLAFFGK